VQRISNCSKIKNTVLTPDKVMNVWYMDYSALIKSNTLEVAWNGRNMGTVNNGWVVILVKYGFIRLFQRIFNCDKMHDISIISDEVLNSLVYGSPFCVIIYTRYKLSKMVRFFMAQINWYFRRSIVSPNLCQEYLNMATFRILGLLLIKSSTFLYIDRLPTSSYTGVIHF